MQLVCHVHAHVASIESPQSNLLTLPIECTCIELFMVNGYDLHNFHEILNVFIFLVPGPKSPFAALCEHTFAVVYTYHSSTLTLGNLW